MQRFDVIKHRQVLRDLGRAWSYLLEHASVMTAERFLKNAEKTFDNLAILPTVGAYYQTDVPALQSLRLWPIKGFKRYIIYYAVFESRHRIHVVRVLHSALDIDSMLNEDDLRDN